MPETLTFDEFAAKYCERQVSTPDELRHTLQSMVDAKNCTGFMLLECQVLDGRRCGELTILAYGPNNTYKDVPDYPISPRGLASDMSIVAALLPASAL